MFVDKKEIKQRLRKLIKRGDTVYTVLHHVSSSGMMRHISVHVIKKNKPIDITYLVGNFIDFKFSRTSSHLKVHGCGMDMGFHVVYELSNKLFDRGKDAYSGEPNRCGGYAIKHQWIG